MTASLPATHRHRTNVRPAWTPRKSLRQVIDLPYMAFNIFQVALECGTGTT